MREREQGPARRRVVFVLDAHEADAFANEPVLQGEEVVGWVTSGGYCHHIGKSVALGYLPSTLAEASNGEFAIEVLGKMIPATVSVEPPFDAEGNRMRS